MDAPAEHIEYYLRLESQIWCVDASWNGGVSHTIFFLVTVNLTLTSGLVSMIIVSGVHLILFEEESLVCGCILE